MSRLVLYIGAAQLEGREVGRGEDERREGGGEGSERRRELGAY